MSDHGHESHGHDDGGGHGHGGHGGGEGVLSEAVEQNLHIFSPEEILVGHGGVVDTVENVGMSPKAGFDVLGSMTQVVTGGQGPEGAGGGGHGGGGHGHGGH